MFFFKKLLAQASNPEPALQNQNAKPLHYSLVCVVFYYYNIYLVYTFLIILLGRPFIHDLHFDSRSAADGDYQSASPRAPTLFSSRTCCCSWTCSPPPAVACLPLPGPERMTGTPTRSTSRPCQWRMRPVLGPARRLRVLPPTNVMYAKNGLNRESE